MKRNGNALLLAVLVLAGCGGSDDVDPNLKVGKSTATPVENLRYRTATQEGRTDKDGNFNYLPGETVQFFVGHILLTKGNRRR